jgi:hypothetical protein
MKKINTYLFTVVAGMLLMTASCTQEPTEAETKTIDVSEMTTEQKQVIEKKISALTQAFFQNIEKLDIEGFMALFESTPEFLAANLDGTSSDYNSLKKMNGDAFSQTAGVSLILKKEAVRILSDSNVLYTFFAEQEITLKTGEKMTFEDMAGTILFTKINGEWKATFYHESALAPVVGDSEDIL